MRRIARRPPDQPAPGAVMTVPEFESIAVTAGIAGLCLYMLFVIYKLAEESKAGRFGTLVLFLALGLGIFGFAAKEIISLLLGI